ncbi:phosphoadenosine phosphosulfate reductase family protein [Maridesulfovibrio sp.]|uniref:phosphoadenosine phosphosulfate reductase domain-containing protein n=1 Tax=Maridesulfovibrio sp. TaxID=2795000 RepID=UPI002AA9596E|nr:phosphoadenosine phosphosulfate reductase family protein [Maridesulfovibrio sp.]
MSSENNVVSFSGGKDSTALLLMMLEKGIPVHSAVFFDTGWEFPLMCEHIDRLEKYTGLKIQRVKPKTPFPVLMMEREIVSREVRVEKIGPAPPPQELDYDDGDDFRFDYECWELDPFEYKKTKIGEVYRIGYGWPSPLRRWCTREKVGAIDAYIKRIESAVSCIGYAADEAHRTQKKTLQKKAAAGFKYRFPLIEWGVDEAAALSICKSHGFDWGGLYEHFHRVSCFCCPLQRIGDLRTLRRHYPLLWETMLEWDERITLNPGKHNGFKDHVTVRDFEARFAEEDRFLKLPLAVNE